MEEVLKHILKRIIQQQAKDKVETITKAKKEAAKRIEKAKAEKTEKAEKEINYMQLGEILYLMSKQNNDNKKYYHYLKFKTFVKFQSN
tara:strand:+ start:85 stop:348 length:264 start_codon:yes stop_codon:yes gene_type:complete